MALSNNGPKSIPEIPHAYFPSAARVGREGRRSGPTKIAAEAETAPLAIYPQSLVAEREDR